MSDRLYKAYYHLPGLFEFYELYKRFLPVFYEHRNWFYDWCDIGSIYGAPSDCLWGGGRVGFGDCPAKDVIALMNDFHLSPRLTFSNSLLKEEHLSDKKCNKLCALFEEETYVRSGVIVHSDLLLDYLKKNYPELYFSSSTTKVLTEFEQLRDEVCRDDFYYVVPDFRLNKCFDKFEVFDRTQKEKLEFICNECCWIGCKDRKLCYENVSRKNLGEDCEDFVCRAPGSKDGYLFSEAMKNPSFISVKDITDVYLPGDFSNFKIEGRSLGSAVVLEFLLYYMAKPEYAINVREKIYLSNSLDLF